VRRGAISEYALCPIGIRILSHWHTHFVLASHVVCARRIHEEVKEEVIFYSRSAEGKGEGFEKERVHEPVRDSFGKCLAWLCSHRPAFDQPSYDGGCQTSLALSQPDRTRIRFRAGLDGSGRTVPTSHNLAPRPVAPSAASLALPSHRPERASRRPAWQADRSSPTCLTVRSFSAGLLGSSPA
jgi:hypothetical protein